ncbi:uncharacterized protein LOC142588163 isoform X1 [Dermacentor variabilis]|uniref:uncharacterized protein LOC142588163 isoform X1 n=1 Tax=Dermacentor variabilis TaxID=34621 RepID=UPI003F5B481F
MTQGWREGSARHFVDMAPRVDADTTTTQIRLHEGLHPAYQAEGNSWCRRISGRNGNIQHSEHRTHLRTLGRRLRTLATRTRSSHPGGGRRPPSGQRPFGRHDELAVRSGTAGKWHNNGAAGHTEVYLITTYLDNKKAAAGAAALTKITSSVRHQEESFKHWAVALRYAPPGALYEVVEAGPHRITGRIVATTPLQTLE